MSEAINKVKYQQFLKQAKGNDVSEIHVTRVDRGAHLVLRYNAKSRKGGRVMTGEWLIDAKDKDGKDRDEAALTADMKTFLERARKDFFVKREAGLTGDAFKSVQEDEAAKTKQLEAAPPEK